MKHVANESSFRGAEDIWFEELFGHILKPLARRDKHPDCFYHSMRLVAVDGSKWSLRVSGGVNIGQIGRFENRMP